MRFLFLIIGSFVSFAAFAEERNVISTAYGAGAWSPYLVGALIGVLSWCTFYFSEKPIGASSFYATIAGFLGKWIAPAHTQKLSYYKDNPPSFNWEFVLVLSIVAGSLLAATTGGDFSISTIPAMWTDHFGPLSLTRYAATSVGGGILMGLGARLAGGCTSGHGISGTLQLNVASWVSVICFFLGGVAAIRIIY